MDYLQEGIHLRAMGQKDPLVEWQREGYNMFESLVENVAADFVKYVMHLQVVRQEAPQPDEVRDVSYSAPEDPVGGSDSMKAAAVAEAAATSDEGPVAVEPEVNTPVVKSAEQKVGRNEPCWCGSGKKYKLCHGR
jgi:preprotein translocase subunit SecA